MQKKTKIHLDILKAIEGDGLTNLSPVYLKSFLKIYCRFLGVEPRQYIPDYKEMQSKFEPGGKEKAPAERKEIPVKMFDNTTASLKPVAAGIGRYKKIFLIIIVAAVGLFLIFRLGRAVVRHRPSATREQPAVVSQKKKAASLPAVASNPNRPKSNLSEITVTLSAKENCLITLRADGRVLFRRVLEKGRSETWQAKNRIDLYVGNAGGVELIVNGQRFPSLGRRGQVIKDIVITKEGLRIP